MAQNTRSGTVRIVQALLAIFSILAGAWLPAGTAYASERDYEVFAVPSAITGGLPTTVGVGVRNVSDRGNVSIQWIQFRVPQGMTLNSVTPPDHWTFSQSGNVVTFSTEQAPRGIHRGETGPGGSGDLFEFTVDPSCSLGEYTFTVLDVDDNNGTGSGQPWNLFGSPAQVVVVPGDTCPVANIDNYSTTEETPLTVPALTGVLANDTPAGVSAALFTGPAHGDLTLNSDGSFTYTPEANFSGTDTFTYTANTGSEVSAPAVVMIVVLPANDAPVANPDTYAATEDTALTVPGPGLLSNDTDSDNNPLHIQGNTNPSHGTLALNPDGSFTYTPDSNFCGQDSFTYWVTDGSANSAPASVVVNVACVNDAPAATNDEYSTSYATALTIPAPGVLANDTDADTGTPLASALSASLVAGPGHGTVALNANGSFTYTPAGSFTGDDSFTYKANDGTADSNVATVTIHVGQAPQMPPVAANDSYATAEDTLLTVVAPGALANDSDPNGDSLAAVLVSDVSHGTLVLNGDGSFTYTPAANYSGADSFTYKANDGNADSNTATVNIAVTPVNDPPTAVDDAYTTAEDTPLNVPAAGVLANDTDMDNAHLYAMLLTSPAHGAVTLNGDGSFVYTPAANYHGTDSFTYKANDNTSDSAPATVTITITAINDPPVAVNDSYSAVEDSPLTVGGSGVLSNDSDVDGDELGAYLVGTPAHGTVTLSANGGFTYVPEADFTGTDTFTYKANDGTADSNVATVSIVVTGANDAPVAVNDSYATAEDTVLTVPATGVLTNDTDTDHDPLTAMLAAGPGHGTLTLNPDGSFTYTPASNYQGPDSFTYTAGDGQASSNVATVSITVTSANDAPTPQNDAYSVQEDGTLTVDAPGVLGNDSDPDDGDTLNVIHHTNPQHGTLIIRDDGSFVYTPEPDYCDTDSFTYTVTDGTVDVGPVTVSINVECTPDAPVALDDSYTGQQDQPLSISAPGVLGNDTDADNDSLIATIVNTPANGAVTLNSDGSFTYVPNPGFSGSDSFMYKAFDGEAYSNLATVTINLDNVNDPPTAIDHSYTTAEDTPLVQAAPGVLAGASDPDGDSVTVVLVANVTHGTLTLNPNGSFTYMPGPDFSGTDTFTFKATDGSLFSGVQTATISVTPVNEAPVAVDDSYATAEDTVLNIAPGGVLNNDTDAEGNALTAVLVTGPSHGTLVLVPNGSFHYAPAVDFQGTDTFTYKANDGSADSSTATVTIRVTGVNDGPVANNDTYSTPEDTPLTVPAGGVLSNDTDADGDSLTAMVVANPSHGAVALNSDGSFTYTPAPDFTGTDSFTYKAGDGQSESNVATVTIDVGQKTDPPVAVADSYTTNEDTALTPVAPGVLGNDTDPDGDTLAAFLVSSPLHGTVALSPDGSFTYMPAPNFHGTDTFVYKAYDGALYSESAMVTITVTSVNDRPVAVNDNYSTAFGTALSPGAPGILGNDSDPDGNSLTAINVSAPAHGSLVLNANGSFLYTPSSGFSGLDSFTYKVSDGAQESNTATVTIHVGKGNPPPPDPEPLPSNAVLSVTVATVNDKAQGTSSVMLTGGGTVYYFYTFTNTGSSALTINSAVDSVVGAVSLSPTLLMPGQSATGTATKSFPALAPGSGSITTTNKVTVRSTSTTDELVERTASASVTNQALPKVDGSITVRVLDATNRNAPAPAGAPKPMAGVPVQLGSLTGTTNAGGEVTFAGLAFGTYTASAKAHDPQNPASPEQSNSGTATISDAKRSETITLEFSWSEFYGAGSFTVIVLDGSADLDGKTEPVKDAVVDLGGSLHGKTDAQGRITFSLDPGAYNMTVTAVDPKNRGGDKLQGDARVVTVTSLSNQTLEVVLKWAPAPVVTPPPVESTGSLYGQICIPWPPGAELTAYGPGGEVKKITVPSDKNGRLGYMVDYRFPNLAVGQWRLVLSTPTAQGRLLEKTVTVRPGENPVPVFELVCTGQPAPASPIAPWLFYLAGGALVAFGITLQMRLRRKRTGV